MKQVKAPGSLILSALGWVLAMVLALPILSLVAQSVSLRSAAVLLEDQTQQALGLSLLSTTLGLSFIVLFGTPLSYVLAREKAPWSGTVQTLVQLPVVLPPAVAGVALLSAFGQRGWLGPVLDDLHIHVVFSTAAVVLAGIFVAGPIYVQGALNAFAALDEETLLVARTMGAGPLRVFWQIALPLSRPALFSAALLCTARALGEFGATLMFAGNLPGVSQTLPLLIYAAMESDFARARALSLVLLLLSAVMLILSLKLSHKWRKHR